MTTKADDREEGAATELGTNGATPEDNPEGEAGTQEVAPEDTEDDDTVDTGVLPPDPEESASDAARFARAAGTSSAALALLTRRRLPLGALLVEAACINSDQLEMALAEQRRTRALLGEVLVSLSFTTEETVAEAVSRQTGIEFLRMPREPLPPNLKGLVLEDTSRRHRLVPLGIEGSTIRLAMANPFDVIALDTIRASTGLVPIPVIAPWSDIAAVIEKSFSRVETFDETFEKLIASSESRVGSDEVDAVARGPLVELVDQLIFRAADERATDIHIEPEEMVLRVRYRIDSVLQPGPMIPKKLQLAIAARIKVMAELNISESRVPQSGHIRFAVKGRQIDLRVSTFLCNYGESIVLRVLDRVNAPLSMDKLGLFGDDLEQLNRIIAHQQGIVLVTGPTSSGKTTTLYAALMALNTTGVKIMTIEDPIEYELTLVCQSQVNLKAGITFASGMRAILRQDPNIILVGELRDEETVQAALRAATTGHLVFSTMLTRSAAGTVSRLLEMGMEPSLAAEHLIAVIGQRLVRRVCKCRRLVPAPADRHAELEAAAKAEGIAWNGMVVEPAGCCECRQSGFHGRRPLFEILDMENKEIQQAFLKKRGGRKLEAAARQAGMHTMYQSGLRLVFTHQLPLDELDRVCDGELRI